MTIRMKIASDVERPSRAATVYARRVANGTSLRIGVEPAGKLA